MEYDDHNDSNIDESWKSDESGSASTYRDAGLPVPPDAKSIGRSAEDNASKPSQGKSQSAKNSETPSLYRSSNNSSPNSLYKSSFQKRGKFAAAVALAPLVGIMLAVAGIGILFALIQIPAPFAWLANATTKFNTQPLAFNLSTDTLVKSALDGEIEFSDETIENFKKNRIEYKSGSLQYQNPVTQETVTVTSGNLDDTLKDSYFFADAYNTSLRATKGPVAGWWDKSAKMYTDQIGNSRNKLIDYTQATPEFDEVTKAVQDNGAEVKVVDRSSNTTTDFCEWDGSIIGIFEWIKCIVLGSDTPQNADVEKGMSESEINDKLKNRAKKAMLAGDSQEASNGCKGSKAVAAVSSIGTAGMKIQLINTESAFAEAVDKAKSGDGGGALNAYMRKLSERGETKWLNESSEWQVVEGKENSSPLESQAWNSIAGDEKPPTADDPLVKTFNMDFLISDSFSYNEELKSKLTSEFYSDEEIENCLSTTNYVDATDLYQNHEGSGPAGGLFSSIASFIKRVFYTLLGTYDEKTQAIADTASKRTHAIFDMDIEELTGETFATALWTGANINYGQKHIMNSGTVGTESQLVEQYQTAKRIEEQEAEIARHTKSPFDATNKHTFLGHLVRSVQPIVSKLTTPLNAFSSFVGTTFSSVRSLVPIASAADDENEFKETLRDDCPTPKFLQTSEGVAVSDAFCGSKAYQNTDKEVVETRPNDVRSKIQTGASEYYKGVNNFEGEDSDGNPKINPKGEYAAWLVSCSVKKSQWGYISGQSSSFIQEQLFGNGSSDAKTTTSDSLENGLEVQPIDDIRKKEKEYEKVYDRPSLDWASGLNCMGGSDGSLKEQVDMYAQYTTYQNMLEVMGNYETAAPVAFLQDYYDQHPYYLNTVEGVLAEYSGLTLEDVDLALGYVEYYDFLAHYDPSNRSPLDPIPEADPIFFEDSSVIATIFPEAVVYFNDTISAPRREFYTTA